MTNELARPSIPLNTRWRVRLFGAVAAGVASALVLVACGGGGSSDAGTTPGASAASFTAGPISGLGSIIVNGVRFDDSKASVQNQEDGSSGTLKLGMMVEVEASKIDAATARATASTVRFGSEIVGPVASPDSAAQTIKVLDQTVQITATTVFEDSLAGGFAALTAGKVVEIHALFDATTGRYAATRIEDETGATAFRLRGVIAALDTTAKTFRIGAAVINYAGIAAADLPALANDLKVRVRLQTTQVAGQWIATSVRSGVRRVDDHEEAGVFGLVSAFTSAQHFFVQGTEVDATNAAFEPAANAVKLGALVSVRGAARNGVVVASKVKVLTGFDDAGLSVELHGALSSLDLVARTFVLREVKVDFSHVTVLKNITIADLSTAKAAHIEVEGVWSADRRTLIASTIKLDD